MPTTGSPQSNIPAASTAWLVADRARTHLVELPDARLRVALVVQAGRLHVERELQGRDGVNRLVVQEFQRLDDFERWWGTDTLRFKHPLLHVRVRRDASALCGAGLDSERHARRAG